MSESSSFPPREIPLTRSGGAALPTLATAAPPKDSGAVRALALVAVENALGYTFSNVRLLERALTHSSFANEVSRTREVKDNETFEFLGDSVIGFLIAEQLLEGFPELREGPLSKAKAHFVSEAHLASLARRLHLGDSIRLATGESRSGGRLKDSLLADAFEAVVAAIYLDAGLETTRAVCRRLWAHSLDEMNPNDLAFSDYKTTLQEMAQAAGKPLPVYRLVSQGGPEHRKVFLYEVAYDENVRATGEGYSKKDAQRQAAKAALELLRVPV